MNFRRFGAFVVFLAMSGVLLRATTVLDYIPLSIDGKPVPLASYRDKVLLIVNVASKSIFTPQYQGLEALYEKYKDQGLVILAFPSDDFGKEEPDGNEAIKQFAAKYKVTFPVFAKIAMAGEHMAPLYQFLTDKQANPNTGGPIRWNFTKFLVDREGKVVERFEPDMTPDSPELAAAIEKALHRDKEKHDGGATRAAAPRPQWVGSGFWLLTSDSHSVSLRYTVNFNRPCSRFVLRCTNG
jgi:glutathione peroxidase